jgi:hypothetical protein
MAVRYRLMLKTTRSTQKLTTITTMGAELLFVVKLNRLVLHYYFPESSYSCPSSLVWTSMRRIWQWDIDWCWKRQGRHKNLPLLRRWVSRCSLSNLIGLCSTTTSQNPVIHVPLAWYGHLWGEYGSEISIDVRNNKDDTKTYHYYDDGWVVDHCQT